MYLHFIGQKPLVGCSPPLENQATYSKKLAQQAVYQLKLLGHISTPC
jgi:hypothetical protein